jgi:membrane associated rhomboid family serine protease
MTRFQDQHERLKFRFAVAMVISFVTLLWIIKAMELAGDTSYSYLGILPRTLKGSLGIITGPLVHGDPIHLLSNTLPFMVLGVLLFYFYHKIALEIFLWIYFATGFYIWLLARDAYHIGASGVVYGMASFLLFSGIFKGSKQLMAISGVIIFLYGSMLYGVFPNYVDSDVSWEAHLIGAFVGVFLAWWFRKSKTDIEHMDDDHSDDQQDENYWQQATCSDNIEVHYTYKESKHDE